MLKFSINNVKWAAPDMIKTLILNTMDKKEKKKTLTTEEKKKYHKWRHWIQSSIYALQSCES